MQRVIENLTGVRSVLNLVKLKPKVKDIDIQEKIKAAFHRSAAIDSARIFVDVLGTTVTLQGVVRVNKLLGGTMYLLGSNVFNWKIQHNYLHHSYTNIEGYDHDIDSKSPIRLSQYAPLKNIHRYQYVHAFFFYGLMTLSKLVNDFTQLQEFNKAGITR